MGEERMVKRMMGAIFAVVLFVFCVGYLWKPLLLGTGIFALWRFVVWKYDSTPYEAGFEDDQEAAS